MPARGLPILAIRHGRIAAIGDIAEGRAGEIIDAAGLHILPGVIDSQVHFREPGLEHKEDLASGSRSAVLGGVTAVFEMPNTKPLTTSEAALADKVDRARGRMHCDFAFFVGATRDNVDALPELELLSGAAGIKVFMGSSTGDLLVDDEETLSRVLAKIRRRAAFHSEDEARLKERMPLQRQGDPSSHSEWRDAEAAVPRPGVCCGSPRSQANACMCCMSRPQRRWRCSPRTRTSPPSRSRRSI